MNLHYPTNQYQYYSLLTFQPFSFSTNKQLINKIRKRLVITLTGALIVISFGLFFFLLGWIFWSMEETRETFWIALLETIADIFSDFHLSSYRTVALILWLTGFLTVILGIISFNHPEILDLLFHSMK